MKLRTLELENIKSYKNATINFSDGINCIIGKNGSGKSTIISSIGLALFDYSNLKNEQMVRYNCKKGTISLEFEAEDGYVYKIIRKIGTNGNVRIIDCTNDQTLCEGVESVYSFVKKILNIKSDKNLSKMYEEIIAVPQGKYVNAFLEKPAERKKIFEKLLDLNVYKDLSSKIKDIINIIKEKYVNISENNISRYQGQLESYEETVNELEQNQKELEEIFTAKSSEEKKLKEVEKKLSVIEEKISIISKAQTEIEILQEKIRSSDQNLTNLTNSLEEYNSDAIYCSQNAIKHKQYGETKIIIEELSTKLEKKNKVKSSIEHTIEINKNKKESKKNYIQERGKKILEKEKNEKNIKTIEKESEDLLKEKETIEKEIISLKENLVLLENKTKDLEKENEYIEKECLQYMQNSNKFEDYEKQGTNKMSFLEEQMFQKRKRITEKEQISREKDNQLAYLKVKIENLQNNAGLLKIGKCPFKNTECLVLKDYKNSDINSEITNLKNEEIETENQLTKLILEKRESENELRKAQLELQNYQHDQEQYNQLLQRYKNNNFKFVSSEETLLSNIYKSIKDYSTESNSKLKENKELLEQLKSTINDKKIKIKELEVRLENNSKTIGGLIESIPISDQEIDNYNFKIEKIREEIYLNEEHIVKLEKDLEKYGNVEEQLEQKNTKLQELQEVYDNYNSRIKNCDKIDGVKEQISTEEKNKKNLFEQLDTNNKIISDSKSDYNKEEHNLLLNQKKNFSDEIAKYQGIIEEKSKQIVKLQEQIEKLNEVKNQLAIEIEKSQKYSSKVEFLNLSRRVFEAMPQQLSIQYREFISTMATRLYNIVSSENVRIEFCEDYDVKVIDNINEKNVKVMQQLSGGEQMSVALSIRLAMLRHLAGVNIYFLDEPTDSLDVTRKEKLGDIINEVLNELNQIFIISHDDTFDNITNSAIKVLKKNNESYLSDI